MLALLLFAASASAQAGEPADYDGLIADINTKVEALRGYDEASVAYDAFFWRDPLQPVINSQGNVDQASALRSGPAVQGIIWSADRPRVIINDALYGPGDAVGPYSVDEVTQEGVWVRKGGERFFVALD